MKYFALIALMLSTPAIAAPQYDPLVIWISSSLNTIDNVMVNSFYHEFNMVHSH